MRLRKTWNGTCWETSVRATLQQCVADRLVVRQRIWATTNALKLLETQLDALA